MENKYDVPLDALESSAHVPFEDQVESHDTDPPNPDAVAESRREREALMRIIPGA